MPLSHDTVNHNYVACQADVLCCKPERWSGTIPAAPGTSPFCGPTQCPSGGRHRSGPPPATSAAPAQTSAQPSSEPPALLHAPGHDEGSCIRQIELRLMRKAIDLRVSTDISAMPCILLDGGLQQEGVTLVETRSVRRMQGLLYVTSTYSSLRSKRACHDSRPNMEDWPAHSVSALHSALPPFALATRSAPASSRSSCPRSGRPAAAQAAAPAAAARRLHRTGLPCSRLPACPGWRGLWTAVLQPTSEQSSVSACSNKAEADLLGCVGTLAMMLIWPGHV